MNLFFILVVNICFGFYRTKIKKNLNFAKKINIEHMGLGDGEIN